MSNKKILIACLLIIILVIAAVAGLRYEKIVSDEPSAKTSQPAPQSQPMTMISPSSHTTQQTAVVTTVSATQPEAVVSVRETPYGKILTTEQEGTKDGVHYRVIDAEVLPPTYDLSHRPEPNQPRIVIKKTPHGKTVIAQYDHPQNGTHYQIIESSVAGQLSPGQSDQLRRRIIMQQHYMEQAIHRDMQQMMQQMPPLRFEAPNRYYNPNH